MSGTNDENLRPRAKDSQPDDADHAMPPTGDHDGPEDGLTRRGLLGRVGGVVAGGAALAIGGSLLRPERAEATTGTWTYGTNDHSIDAGTASTGLTSTNLSDGSLSVRNTANSGVGIVGFNNLSGVPDSTGDGIQGFTVTDLGTGVRGDATGKGAGVWGASGSATGIGVKAQGGRAQLQLVPGSTAGKPTSGDHVIGEVYMDSLGRIWQCVAAGTPGTWMKPGFNPVTPFRVFDSSPRVAAGDSHSRVVTIAGSGGGAVPTVGVSAIAINIEVQAPSAAGYVVVFPDGATRPYPLSSVNFAAGQTVANYALTPLGSNGKIRVYLSSGTARVIIDVSGFLA